MPVERFKTDAGGKAKATINRIDEITEKIIIKTESKTIGNGKDESEREREKCILDKRAIASSAVRCYTNCIRVERKRGRANSKKNPMGLDADTCAHTTVFIHRGTFCLFSSERILILCRFDSKICQTRRRSQIKKIEEPNISVEKAGKYAINNGEKPFVHRALFIFRLSSV